MKIVYSSRFKNNLKRLIQKQKDLAVEIGDVIEMIIVNPNYPGLRKHKLMNDLDDYWSVSISENLRITFYYSGDTMVLSNIGSHHEVYEEN